MTTTDWEAFFNSHAPVYDRNCFTTSTTEEVDFLLEILDIPPGSSILDIGCGTGRHSIELAKRGYKMTGVDLSSGMLAQAKEKAKEAGLEVNWIKANAVDFVSPEPLDAAICLCEGAFCLMGMDEDPEEHDLAILHNIYNSIKPGARFVLTALNGLAKIRKFDEQHVDQGVFDPISLTETFKMELDTPEGKQHVMVRERGYVPTELKFLFSNAGFETEHIYGGTAGNWGRRRVDLDEIEIMVVGRKVES